MIYYWETEDLMGRFNAESDEQACASAQEIPELWVLYRERNTSNGEPFVVLYDHNESIVRT